MAVIGEPEAPLSASNFLAVPEANVGNELFVNASCGGLATYKCPSGKGDPNGYAAVVYLYAADLTLEQVSQPVVANVGGELANAVTLSGTADLSFEAGDPGSGVYQTVFAVDGAEVGRTLIDEDGGRCRDVGETSDGLPAFLYLEPCAPSLSADVPFDTTTLADGTHHLVVSVTDAAGNSTVALDRKIDVLNHPALPGSGSQAPPSSLVSAVASPPAIQGEAAPNGSHASAGATLSARWSSTTHSSLSASYGKSHTVTGRLLAPSGAPIAGATVQALFRPTAQGGAPRALAPARTGADGGFHLELPASTPSGQLTLAYGSRLGQPAPDVTATLTLSVPASLSLRVAPRVSRAGGTIHFAGTLRGGPLPAGGKQLVLEAKAPGGPWRQFQVLSTRAHGRFQASYRFRLPGPVVYRFRVNCPHEADFPFARGDSNLVSVRER